MHGTPLLGTPHSGPFFLSLLYFDLRSLLPIVLFPLSFIVLSFSSLSLPFPFFLLPPSTLLPFLFIPLSLFSLYSFVHPSFPLSSIRLFLGPPSSATSRLPSLCFSLLSLLVFFITFPSYLLPSSPYLIFLPYRLLSSLPSSFLHPIFLSLFSPPSPYFFSLLVISFLSLVVFFVSFHSHFLSFPLTLPSPLSSLPLSLFIPPFLPL